MELRLSVPFPLTRTSLTALSNIYLLLSVFVIQAYATERPDKLITHHSDDREHDSHDTRHNNDQTHHSDLIRVEEQVEISRVEPLLLSSQSKHNNLERRSLDSYYYYYDGEEDDFSPSARFESTKQSPSIHNSHTSGHGHQRQEQRYSHFRPGRNQSPRLVQSVIIFSVIICGAAQRAH